ncbi:hypothetical protein [Fibrobacter sp. UWB11]|uniref:hypothetical protein n=1 Tax=Fibrobacter sp. UWB11 TaxID=1896202 RepID=UPI00092708D8|nr:hypothetical protein [Fibrobacter sp. UWB11]SIO05642.1 hypothetical protein SAMN05720758_1205 [Fibrobacter sp. UWB11]
MKKAYTFLFGMFMFVACSDDNPTSGLDNTQNKNPSVQSNVDFGEGYTYAIPIKYDEATGRVYQGTYACNYHPDTKTFAWEEYPESLDPGTYKIVGDSLWMGPTEKQISEDSDEQQFLDTYYNYETLSLSNDHNDIYGTWKVTGCRRNLGDTEIKCSKYIGGLSGIARTMQITKDSIYITTTIDTDNLEPNDVNIGKIINRSFGFDIGDAIIKQLMIENTIKKESKDFLTQSFSIGNQLFEVISTPKFDATGMNYISTISSNGKTCTNTQRLGFINEKLCKEETAEFLLSARDKSDDQSYYKEGPVEGFSIDNDDEFNKCAKELPTEETRQLLRQYSRE